MKFKRNCLVTLSVLLLSGCVDLSPVNPIKTTSNISESVDDSKVNVMEDHQQSTTKKQQLQQLIAKRFEALEKVSMNLAVSTTINDQLYKVKEKTEELYEEGQLKGYLVTNQIEQNSHELEEQIYYTGDGYYYRFNSNSWQNLSGDTKSTILYISLMKYLFEGSDEWQLDESENNVMVKRKIEDEQLLTNAPQLFSLPMMLSKNTQIEMDAQYRVDTENGDITYIVMNMVINDLDSQYKVKIESNINSKAEFENWQIDTNQTVSLDTSQKEQQQLIAEANPYQVINYLETYRDDQTETTLIMGNYLNGEPYSLIEGVLKEQSLTNVSFWKANRQYQEIEGNVEIQEVKQSNRYAQFVQRLDEQYDLLEQLEATEESTFITLREFFEQDYEQFSSTLTELDKEVFNQDNKVYGIDYLINKETYQLMGVILWSADAITAEVGATITLNFDNFNVYNPSLLMDQVSDQILEKINE
ncbi:MAG TPA: hypothetical protein K8V19_02720 [Globicatella sulfidifaciens]|nr:hypothetical protein [Globicatella sulfidifaciens]